jgi:hypothetical protein
MRALRSVRPFLVLGTAWVVVALGCGEKKQSPKAAAVAGLRVSAPRIKPGKLSTKPRLLLPPPPPAP